MLQALTDSASPRLVTVWPRGPCLASGQCLFSRAVPSGIGPEPMSSPDCACIFDLPDNVCSLGEGLGGYRVATVGGWTSSWCSQWLCQLVVA